MPHAAARTKEKSEAAERSRTRTKKKKKKERKRVRHGPPRIAFRASLELAFRGPSEARPPSSSFLPRASPGEERGAAIWREQTEFLVVLRERGEQNHACRRLLRASKGSERRNSMGSQFFLSYRRCCSRSRRRRGQRAQRCPGCGRAGHAASVWRERASENGLRAGGEERERELEPRKKKRDSEREQGEKKEEKKKTGSLFLAPFSFSNILSPSLPHSLPSPCLFFFYLTFSDFP